MRAVVGMLLVLGILTLPAAFAQGPFSAEFETGALADYLAVRGNVAGIALARLLRGRGGQG
ncbi:MAG TPA: hypothetical protein PK794_04620, partial [Armatimonadota bacterium]|nr:hypothetical protein [Armatimonadota bacterium]